MNKVILMGRLVDDPAVRELDGKVGKSVANFKLAVDRKFVKKDDVVKADFIPIVAWAFLADFAKNYLRKGQKIAVTGRMQIRSWDDPEKNRHWITEVIADEIDFAEGKTTSVTPAKSAVKSESTFNDADDGFYPLPADDDLPF